MEISTEKILKVLYIFSWIIFVGLCIEAGGHIVNAVFSITKPDIVKYLWHEVDLASLFEHDRGQFFVEMLFMSIVAIMKALLFYMIIKILHDKKLNMAQPFNREVQRFIVLMSYIALVIGLFSGWGIKYAEWLVKQGVEMPGLHSLRLGGADVWVFMAVILFVIAQIFKKGIEIQTENELTV